MASTQTLITDQEGLDAQRVDEALRCIQAQDASTASQLLSEVIANAPQDYVYKFERDGVLHVKFWDREEFLRYGSRMIANGQQ